jgi:hypothetical protein
MVRPERIELPTSWFVAKHSIQLSYGRVSTQSSVRFVELYRNQNVSPNSGIPLITKYDHQNNCQNLRAAFDRIARIFSPLKCRTGRREYDSTSAIAEQRKSFRFQRKTYPLASLRFTYCQRFRCGMQHALARSDEVARNGAFGKILRPEVFPNAPCILASLRRAPSRFVTLPR